MATTTSTAITSTSATSSTATSSTTGRPGTARCTTRHAARSHLALLEAVIHVGRRTRAWLAEDARRSGEISVRLDAARIELGRRRR